MSQIALQLTCYNGSRYLPYLFASLSKQTLQGWKLYVLDNGSTEEEAARIAETVKTATFPVELLRVQDTLNFARGHNLLFTKHEADFVQLINDDAFLEPTYLALVAQYMTTHVKCAAASGLIYRWNFDRAHDANGGRTNIIDSAGLTRAVYWEVRDSYQRETVAQAYAKGEPEIAEVFGVSGCLPMYRRTAVLGTSPDQTLFDGTFVAYKEDVELATRLQEANFSAAVVHKAVAYHRRTFRQASRAEQKFNVLLNSYRNHWWILLMHLPSSFFLRALVTILPYEIAKMGYWLVLRPRVVLQAVRDTIQQWPDLMRKRRFYLRQA